MQRLKPYLTPRLLGILAAILAIALWIYFMISLPSIPDVTTSDTWQITTLMLILAAVGLVAVWFERPFIMLGVFIASFFPVGMYMLGVPSLFRLVGVADLAFLLSALILLSQRFRIQKIR